MLKNFLLVGFGGMIGSMARYGVGIFATNFLSANFPFGTLAVNVIGSFLIGIVFVLAESTNVISSEGRIFLAAGFCGGFTTFSSFMLDIHGLIRDGEIFYAAGYFFLSIILGFAALWLGIICTKLVFKV